MPGLLLHIGMPVKCVHGGAVTLAPNPRVLVNGQATVLQVPPSAIVGCPFNVSGSPVPCVAATWTSVAVRITSNTLPLLLVDSQATCAPNSTPVLIVPVPGKSMVTGM